MHVSPSSVQTKMWSIVREHLIYMFLTHMPSVFNIVLSFFKRDSCPLPPASEMVARYGQKSRSSRRLAGKRTNLASLSINR
jgi:hypothetical protein